MFLFRTWSTVRLVAVLLSLGIHQSIWEAVSYLRESFPLYSIYNKYCNILIMFYIITAHNIHCAF